MKVAIWDLLSKDPPSLGRAGEFSRNLEQTYQTGVFSARLNPRKKKEQKSRRVKGEFPVVFHSGRY